MSKVKVVATVVAVCGIAGLSAVGVSQTDIGATVTLGIGLGSVVAALVAAIKKK